MRVAFRILEALYVLRFSNSSLDVLTGSTRDSVEWKVRRVGISRNHSRYTRSRVTIRLQRFQETSTRSSGDPGSGVYYMLLHEANGAV